MSQLLLILLFKTWNSSHARSIDKCEKSVIFVVRNEIATGIGYAEKSYLNHKVGKNYVK